MDRNIAHFDLDAFFVGVERLRNPALKGQPLIIGGAGRRGVVAACSYETRPFGVHSAMPLYMALQLCPEAKVIPGNMEAYTYYSSMVTEIIAESAPLYEKASIDEFYVDATGLDRYFGAFRWAMELRKKIIRETGLPMSMALSSNKLVSKVATGEYKPDAGKLIPPGTEKEFLGPLGVEKIPMIGKKTTALLHGIGVRTVSDLRQVPLNYLISAFGKAGIDMHHKAHAFDNSPVVPYTEQKSISTEQTFDEDTVEVPYLRRLLTSMVEKTAFELRNQQKVTSCVTVKIRHANFETETKQVQVPFTSSDPLLIKTTQGLFNKLYTEHTPLRLIGVRFSHLVQGKGQATLFDAPPMEETKLYEAMDFIRQRHGLSKLMRATGVNRHRQSLSNPMYNP